MRSDAQQQQRNETAAASSVVKRASLPPPPPTPSRSSAASLHAPTPLPLPRRTIASSSTSLLAFPSATTTTKGLSGAAAQDQAKQDTTTTTLSNSSDAAEEWNDDDDEEEEEEGSEPKLPTSASNDDISSPIASRTRRGRLSKMNLGGNNNPPNTGNAAQRRSLLAPPSAFSASSLARGIRPSSALGKRRAERDADEDDEGVDYVDEESGDGNGAAQTVSEFGAVKSVGGSGTSRAPPTSRITAPASTTGRLALQRRSNSPSKLQQPSASATGTAAQVFQNLRSASPLKSITAARQQHLLAAGGSGVGTGMKSRVRTSLGSLGSAFQSSSSSASAGRKIGSSLRVPGAPDPSAGSGSSGLLPRPRKLSRPSTAGDPARNGSNASTGTASSSGLPVPPKSRIGSSSALSLGNKRFSLQAAAHFGIGGGHAATQAHGQAPPDSFANVAGPSSAAAIAPPSSVPPSASSFKFALGPSASSARSGAAGIPVPLGSTPLRPPNAPVHPAIASLRPPHPGGGAKAQPSLSKMLLPTPDARERGKKRLSGMSLGSNTSLSGGGAVGSTSIGGAGDTSAGSASVARHAAGAGDKENALPASSTSAQQKGKAAMTRSYDDDQVGSTKKIVAGASAPTSPTMKDWHVLQQLHSLAQSSGLSLEHLRGLISSSGGADISSEAKDAAQRTQGDGIVRQSLLPPAAARGSRHTADSSLGAVSPLSDISLLNAIADQDEEEEQAAEAEKAQTKASSRGPGRASLNGRPRKSISSVVGEETIDLVNLSMSPPGSAIGSPLGKPDESLLMATLDGGAAAGPDRIRPSTSSSSALGSTSSGLVGISKGVRDDEEEEESDLDQVESPLMAIAALRPSDLSGDVGPTSKRHGAGSRTSVGSAASAGAGGSKSRDEVRLVAGPLPTPEHHRRRRSARNDEDDRKADLNPGNSLGILSSPLALTPTVDDDNDEGVDFEPSGGFEDTRIPKSSSDSNATERGFGTTRNEHERGSSADASWAVLALDGHGGEQTAAGRTAASDEVQTLRAELELARLEAERQRDLHQLKLAEYEDALAEIRDSRRARPADRAEATVEQGNDKDGSSSASAALSKLQTRLETMQADQARSRKLYESELAGLEEAVRAANERALIAESERAKSEVNAAERARVDEEARHALSEEAERAMMALVEEREVAKADEAQLRAKLEEEVRVRLALESASDGAKSAEIEALGAQLAEMVAEVERAEESRRLAEQERAELERQVGELYDAKTAEAGAALELRRELAHQERVVEECLGTRRRVLGQVAASAWGDLADYGRNELLLLDGQADMCHFLLAQLDLWDSLVQKAVPDHFPVAEEAGVPSLTE